MELIGNIIHIGETETFGDKGFRKRQVVIETEEQYKQKISIEFIQDKTELLNKYNLGQNVNISINIQGREWVNPSGETKYFNTINGWKIFPTNGQAQQQQPPVPPADSFEPSGDLAPDDEDDNDLPF